MVDEGGVEGEVGGNCPAKGVVGFKGGREGKVDFGAGDERGFNGGSEKGEEEGGVLAGVSKDGKLSKSFDKLLEGGVWEGRGEEGEGAGCLVVNGRGGKVEGVVLKGAVVGLGKGKPEGVGVVVGGGGVVTAAGGADARGF